MRTLFVGHRVSDLERSLAFYAALGYRVLGRVPMADRGSLVVLSFPEEDMASVELVHRPEGGPVVPGGFDHLAVQVDDLDGTLSDVTARGLRPGPVEFPGGPDGPRTTTLTDPDGYVIELVQWPPGHPVGMTAADFAEE